MKLFGKRILKSAKRERTKSSAHEIDKGFIFKLFLFVLKDGF